MSPTSSHDSSAGAVKEFVMLKECNCRYTTEKRYAPLLGLELLLRAQSPEAAEVLCHSALCTTEDGDMVTYEVTLVDAVDDIWNDARWVAIEHLHSPYGQEQQLCPTEVLRVSRELYELLSKNLGFKTKVAKGWITLGFETRTEESLKHVWESPFARR
jgi:hypothetical protein